MNEIVNDLRDILCKLRFKDRMKNLPVLSWIPSYETIKSDNKHNNTL